MLTNQLDPSQSQIVLYKGNFIKNEFNRFNQRLINHSFQLELSAYPMQQKQLKKEIKFLISQHSLSFKAFRAIFPQIVEITKPKDKLNLIFELFRQFAENPSEEICGRFYWSYYNGKYLEDYKGKKCFLDVTRCMVTRDALVSSIFGIGNSRKLERLVFDTKNEHSFRQAWLRIKKNSQYFTQMQSSNFFAYSFGIAATTRNSPFPGHAFLVIQYLDKQKEIKYQIFQSYLGEFCLKDYLNKNENTLNRKEFVKFLKGLQECVLSNIWTDTLEKFYIKYFNTKKGFVIGSTNPCRGDFEIEWSIGNIEDILVQNKKFESFKKSAEFPKIEACGCCLFEEQTKTMEEQALEAQTKNLRLQALDKKLRVIYEKNEPIISQPSIRVELDTLGLDLTEVGLISVPARDEYGKLIMDKEDVRWIEQVITLKQATEDVIAELNKLIQNSSEQTSTKDKRYLLLSTNKEPFRTYNALGVPEDKFYLSKDEEKSLWLRRIIDALVNKGHIAKLDKINGHGYFIQL